MAKGYKPERAVTSEKIREVINAKFESKGYSRTLTSDWKRLFKRKLPESGGWIRGYRATSIDSFSYIVEHFAVAISDKTDTVLKSAYICLDTADDECKRLGVLEVMFADD